MVCGQSVSVIIINYGRGLLLGLYLLIDVVSLDSAWNAVKKKATILIKSNTYSFIVVKYTGGFPCGSAVKNPPANAGDSGSIPRSGRSLEKEMATHSSILAWEIPWAEEPGVLQSMRSQRNGHNLVTKQQQQSLNANNVKR